MEAQMDGLMIPIDKEFMTALLDSVENWYSINTNKEFILGFFMGRPCCLLLWPGKLQQIRGISHHRSLS